MTTVGHLRTERQGPPRSSRPSVTAAADPRSGSVAMIPCTVRQLEVFLAAAEDCHFACTAQRLGISQAAVSAHIAALEQQFGKALFLRKRGRKPVLSHYGFGLLREARSFIVRTNEIQRPAERCENRAHRTIRVGAGGHLLDDYIKHRLAAFHKLHADLDIECHYTTSPSECALLVQERSVDLLVYTVANPACFPLHAEILRTVRFGLYAGRQFWSSRHATPAQLSCLPFILPPKDSPACGLVRSALRSAGIRCRNVAAHVQFSSVARDLAKQGEGVAALFDTMIAPEDEGDLLKLDVELPTMYRTLFRADNAPDAALRRVEQFLRETLAT